MFDKKLCMDNIYAIAKDKKIKIGDLEKAAGVSAGYLSKLNKEGNSATPGIEILLPIASTLGVSVDFLVSIDYSQLGENEKYYTDFFNKLMSGTDKQKLSWEIESGSYLNSNTEGDDFIHPLFKQMPSIVEHPETGDFIDYTKNVYQSRFLKVDDVRAFENCYHAEITHDGDCFYIMKMVLGDRNYPSEDADIDFNDPSTFSRGIPQDHEEIECYIVSKRGVVSPLCSTFAVGDQMKELITKLYNLVDGDKRRVNVSTDVKNTIDKFMKLEW